MALFSSDNEKEKQHKGILGAFAVGVIKWEPEDDHEASLIVHKFQYEDFPNGSYLIVNQSQMAIFTNNLAAGDSLNADGSAASQVSVFIGPCKIQLETGDSRFAPFRNVKHALTGGESAFHSTVYFVNTTYMNELNWGTQQPFVMFDEEVGANIHVRANGMFGVHIEQVDTSMAAIQARKFVQRVVGTRADYSRKELVDFMRAKILEYVPNLLANNMIEQHVGILRISTKLSEFSKIIHEKLRDHFDEFGLTLDNFSFHSINAPDEDLREINESNIAAAKMDRESAARQRMREREGYSYQQEQAFNVMQAAAENKGTASGLMGAGMGLGMGFGMGGALGGGMSNLAQQTIGNLNMQPVQQQPQMQAPTQAAGTPCPSCGQNVPAGGKFCLNCGTKMEQAACPSCGKPLMPGAKFCMECGASTAPAAPATCPNCGKELAPGAKFCMECGTKTE